MPGHTDWINMNLNLKSEHKTLKNRFENKFSIDIVTGCWNWTASLTHTGYGRIRESGLNSRTLSAHRVSYLLYKGSIQNNLLVLHRCDNRKCVNPEHLFLGTSKDNAIDRERKGRSRPQRGELNANSVLSNELVINIRNMYKNGKRLCDISREFNIATSTIFNAIHHTWKHI